MKPEKVLKTALKMYRKFEKFRETPAAGPVDYFPYFYGRSIYPPFTLTAAFMKDDLVCHGFPVTFIRYVMSSSAPSVGTSLPQRMHSMLELDEITFEDFVNYLIDCERIIDENIISCAMNGISNSFLYDVHRGASDDEIKYVADIDLGRYDIITNFTNCDVTEFDSNFIVKDDTVRLGENGSVLVLYSDSLYFRINLKKLIDAGLLMCGSSPNGPKVKLHVAFTRQDPTKSGKYITELSIGYKINSSEGFILGGLDGRPFMNHARYKDCNGNSSIIDKLTKLI